MDRFIAPLRSRANARNQRLAQYTLTEREPQRRALSPHEEEKDFVDAPLLEREHKRRTIMTNSHRRFHRRAPQEGSASNIKTVNVEVVATVDTAGNVVAQTTVTQQDSAAPTPATQVLPITDATAVSAPSAAPEVSAPAPAADAASTLAVPSVASLPSEVPAAVPSTPSEPSQPVVPSVPAVPTLASQPVLPSVPSVPAVPSFAFPSVPSVPPFPSTLTVPAYPFASPSAGEIAADAVAVSASASSAALTMEPSVVAALTAADSTSSSTSSISASTSSLSSSILSSSPTLSSTMSGFTYVSSPPVMVASATANSSGASQPGSSQSGSSQSDSSPSTTSSSARATPTESLDAAGSSSFYGGDGPGWVGGGGATAGTSTGTPAATDAAAAGNSEAENTTPLDTPQVVGSVVGSLAGAALILAIILILLRRHKRSRGGALQLTDSHPTDHEQAMRQVQVVHQVQAPAPARASLVPSAFLNRFSGLSKSTAETSSPTERSFQRVSGRKLPSAFSEGMTSDQVARGGHMSDSSFYQDDHGTYGGPGMNKEYGGGFGKEIGETSFAGGAGTMNVRPSPAKTPVIHHPGENPFEDTNRTLSPPMSPNPFSDPPLRGALGRSLHSADGSRSSRFTENV